MNIYYTAKDIEDMVAKGIYVLELGPNSSLTDFARETAEQLDVTLIEGVKEPTLPAPRAAAPPASQQAAVAVSPAYNKPRGCQAGSRPTQTGSADTGSVTGNQTNSPPLNRLVDLMGKIINRGD